MTTLKTLSNITFPWDKLDQYKQNALDYRAKNNAKLLDFSIGSPVDDVPEVVYKTLQNKDCVNTPNYPLTSGDKNLKLAISKFVNSNFAASNLKPENTLPTIGSKEMVALLPQMLGLTSGDFIVRPKIAYPTYDIGAQACGAKVIKTDDVLDWAGNTSVKLIWLNYPRNPTGECCDESHLREVVNEARKIGAIVASDECYNMFDWSHIGSNVDLASNDFDTKHPSILSDSVCGGDYTNILQLYSLSKQFNLAGYRSAFVCGDKQIISNLLQIRKHLGLIMPQVVQNVTTALLENSGELIIKQSQVYYNRYINLLEVLRNNNYEISHSKGGLYIWVKVKGKDCWDDLGFLSNIGVIASPGEFYDESASGFLRFALTVFNDEIAEFDKRLKD